MAVISLGYYIAQMRNGQHFPGIPEIPGISLEECLNHVNDYQDFLRNREVFIRQIVQMANNYNCLPLDTLVNGDANHAPITSEIYQSVAEQIYAGIAPASVGYPFLEAPAPVNNQNDMGCFDRYVDSLHEGDESPTRTSVEAIIGRMNELLADKTPMNQRVAGTVVGRVQSGKTRNYVGLMLKAVEQGWNIIFILTSNSNALGQQTVSRIQHDIRNRAGVDNDISLNSINALGAQNQLPICKNNQAAGNIRQGSFFWGVAIKEITHLQDIKNWLEDNRQYVPEMRILIIDDEADAASPDGQRPEDVWSETEIENRLDQIGDIPDNADTELREQRETITRWFQSLFCIELNGDELQTVQDALRGNNAGIIQNTFLGNPTICDLLSLNDYTTEAGNHRNPAADLAAFFNAGGRGRQAGADANIRSHRAFVKFVKSILAVASDKTAINRVLREIIDRADNAVEFTFPFEQCAYIGYTATFYACILNHRPEDTPLYPEFIYSLPKSDRYFGLEEIFGTDLDHAEESRMNIVTPLGDELAICQNLQNLKDNAQIVEQTSGLYIDHNTLDFTLSTRGNNGQLAIRRGSWTTLKEAIAWGFCTAAARRYYRRITEPNFQNAEADTFKRRNGDREHFFTSMLINVAVNVTIHDDLKTIINQYLAFRCAPANRAAFIQECETVWRKFALNDPQNNACLSAEQFEELQGYQPETYPAWNDLAIALRENEPSDLDWFMTHYRVIQHNSTVDGRNDISSYEDGGDSGAQNLRRYDQGETLWFVCGGYTLSRGLTLPGLTSSYFTGINKTTPVDRLTQMGRWFGYRDHYELLPRFWMPATAVEEYKKIARIEQDAHVKIRETFMNRESPFDGANYLTLLYYGKKLSSRAFTVQIMDKKIGTDRFPGDISLKQEDIEQVSQTIRTFLQRWDAAGHRQDYENPVFDGHPTHPVWHLSGNELQVFLNEIKDFYPGNTQRTLYALADEIGRDENQAVWDVVWGGACEQQQQPAANLHSAWRDDWRTEVGRLTPQVVDNHTHIAVFSHAYRPTANFAMIAPEYIWQVDARIYASHRSVILANIRENIEERRRRGAQFPFATYENVLGAGLNDGNLQARLDQYLDNLAVHPASIPGCIHYRLAGNLTYDGYRNRTSRDYIRQVYEQAHHGPTLQIYPVVLADEVANEIGLQLNTQLYAISFFWPGHVPNDFLTVALADRVQIQITEYEFHNAVNQILQEYGFLMSLRTLKNRLRHKFGDRWNDAVWNRFHDEVHGYRRFVGRIAYYAENWAANQDVAQAHLIESIRGRISEILIERGPNANRMSGPDLIRELQGEDKFHDLLSVVTDPNFLYYHVLTEQFCENNNIDMHENGRGTRSYRYQGV